ncbi:hypothetical protein [Piscinibacter sp.]|jgi:hypothetical protein|uniref:hypothetical protein n=1 Tax=Piscinibacter sp. TaxID=1903157 RepID=UPI00355A9A9D
MSSTPLAALERRRLEFGAVAAQAKLALLKQLAHTRLGSARAVMRLHEALCFIRAYPDDAAVLAQVQGMLAAFDRRSDLRAHRLALADTGIAGTATHYRFFAGQAQWLARHWPDELRLDRSEPGADERVARALPPLVTPAEASALIELKLPGYAALDRLRGTNETDAVFLLRRIAAMPADGFTREAYSDIVDAGFVLAPGPGTPSRTAAHFAGTPVVFRQEAPPRVRPDLRAEIARAPRSLRRMPARDGAAIIELARAAMVVRHRSLEAFSFADARDAWIVDHGDGLATALVGVIPPRRHAVASYYGGLTLRNGVPVGYHQADIVGCGAALSFNTFDTFRGGEAAFTFACWLAALRHVFGITSFSVDPYQLGNDEALESGAWWFYAKLGFRPRDATTARLARDELSRVERSPRHRTRAATLRRLAERHLFFDLEPARPHPLFPLAALGLCSGAALSARTGSDRERAVDEASTELLRHCALASLHGFSPDQREAWRRLAPILTRLDLGAWQDDERRALADLIRAKGGRSERDYVARYLAHPKLDAALRQWGRGQGESATGRLHQVARRISKAAC